VIELIAIVAWASSATAIPTVLASQRRSRRDRAEEAQVAAGWSHYFDWLGEASTMPRAAHLHALALPPAERTAA
jgi:GH25 family lysozyme M1 (1,4-beta-N-acetylmuramidase)